MTEEKKLTGYPSIDKPWLKYYSCDPDTVEYRNESLFQMLERCNQNRLHTIALELRTSSNHFEKGITITYSQEIWAEKLMYNNLLNPAVSNTNYLRKFCPTQE